MGNRKDRRAAKANTPEIPLAVPDRREPKAKTLLDLAAERNSDFKRAFDVSANGSGPQPKLVQKIIRPDGSISELQAEDEVEDEVEGDENGNDDPLGPLGQAVFFSITLTLLHLTLDVLVHNQYAEWIYWDLILTRTLKTFPMLLILVYPLHSRADQLWAQGLFLAVCMGAGCYLSYISSENPMLVVMKQAPPVGTLWIWSVLELKVEFAVLGMAVVGGYFLKQGYTIFT